MSEWEKMKYLKEVKLYLKNKERLSSTVVGLYNILIWGQCSKKVQNRCRAHKKCQDIKKNHKVDVLLKVIRDITHQFETQTHLFDALDHAIRKYYIRKSKARMRVMWFMLKTCKHDACDQSPRRMPIPR